MSYLIVKWNRSGKGFHGVEGARLIQTCLPSRNEGLRRRRPQWREEPGSSNAPFDVRYVLFSPTPADVNFAFSIKRTEGLRRLESERPLSASQRIQPAPGAASGHIRLLRFTDFPSLVKIIGALHETIDQIAPLHAGCTLITRVR
jgi:hypothetical protein